MGGVDGHPPVLVQTTDGYNFGVHFSLLDFISSFKIVRILASTCLGLKCDNAYKVSICGSFCHNPYYCHYVCTESCLCCFPCLCCPPIPTLQVPPVLKALSRVCAVTSGHEQHSLCRMQSPWPGAGDAAVSSGRLLSPGVIHWPPCTDES